MALANDSGISLGRFACDEKYHEIAKIPDACDRLDLEEKTITTEAMGC